MAKLTNLRPRVAYLSTEIAQPLPQSLGFSDARRGSRHERGYGWAWVKQRDRVLKRDLYQCQECKRLGLIIPATDVDHIINRAQGGSEDDSQLQSLCRPCHKAKTAREARGEPGHPHRGG